MIFTLKNGYIYTNKIEKMDIVVEDGIIKAIGNDLNEGKIIDCTSLYLAPSFIDPHTHLREPGFENSETIYTGSRAAARGGYTTVFLMPNTNPTISSKESLDYLRNIIKRDSVINCEPLMTITKDEKSEELTDFYKYDIIGASDDGKPVMTSKLMYEALSKAGNKAILCHCEDLPLVDKGILNDCEFTRNHNYKVNLDITETTMVARDLVIAKKTGAHYHICHMASKDTLDLVRFYKSMGCNVTVEVTPHHLVLNDSMLQDDVNFKMNPPIRSKADQEALINGIKEGVIDMISTDHAPHESSKKDRKMEESAFGIVGLETSFPLLYTHLVKTGEIKLEKLFDLMSKNVSDAFGIKGNDIKIGNDANIVLIDIDNEFIIDKNTFISKGRNTPFDGWKVFGKVIKTIYKGEIVYEA